MPGVSCLPLPATTPLLLLDDWVSPRRAGTRSGPFLLPQA